MRVSIVMAAFDAESFVREAVVSVLDQTHGDWELLVVDDGSRDRTAAAVESFADPRVRVLRREHRGVLAQVRNDGIAAAAGEIVALLDADDVWLPEKLARQVEVFRQRPEIGVVHTGAWLLDGDARLPFPPAPAGPLLPELVENNFVVNSSVAMRRSVLAEHGAFDPDPRFRGSPDYELWLRLATLTEFAYVPEPLVLYRRHPAQMTADLGRMSLGGLAALDAARARSPQVFAALGPRLARRTGVLAALAGDRVRARRELALALRHRPWDARAWVWLLRSLRQPSTDA